MLVVRKEGFSAAGDVPQLASLREISWLRNSKCTGRVDLRHPVDISL
jgi:hypothetical protein